MAQFAKNRSGPCDYLGESHWPARRAPQPLAQRIAIVGPAVGEQDRARGRVGDPFRRAGDFAFLASRQLELDWPASPVDERVAQAGRRLIKSSISADGTGLLNK